jgi:SAM-dependent methyltransferase
LWLTDIINRMDPYSTLARYYDLENATLTEDLALWEELAEEYGNPVLELGCGTGRVLLNLARAGCAAVGVDSSAEMLARARARIALNPRLTSRVSLHQADFSHLHLDASFPLVLAPFNTLAHLIEPDAARQTLDSVFRHLNPGGVFAFDLPNPAAILGVEQEGLVLERVFHDEESGSTIQQFSSLRVERLAQLGHVTWIYDETGSDGILHRTSVSFMMRYFFPAELNVLLERAGMRVLHCWGDFDRAPLEDDSPKIVIVAQKAGS